MSWCRWGPRRHWPPGRPDPGRRGPWRPRSWPRRPRAPSAPRGAPRRTRALQRPRPQPGSGRRGPWHRGRPGFFLPAGRHWRAGPQRRSRVRRRPRAGRRCPWRAPASASGRHPEGRLPCPLPLQLPETLSGTLPVPAGRRPARPGPAHPARSRRSRRCLRGALRGRGRWACRRAWPAASAFQAPARSRAWLPPCCRRFPLPRLPALSGRQAIQACACGAACPGGGDGRRRKTRWKASLWKTVWPPPCSWPFRPASRLCLWSRRTRTRVWKEPDPCPPAWRAV